jgi:hypothetical protein
MPFSQRRKRGANPLPPPPLKERPVVHGKRRKLRCSKRGTKHLPAARLVVRDPSLPNSQLVLQKSQDQETQLRNQLKQNYMQVVRIGHLSILSLPIENSILGWLPEAGSGNGSREKELRQQTAGRHRQRSRSCEKRGPIRDSPRETRQLKGGMLMSSRPWRNAFVPNTRRSSRPLPRTPSQEEARNRAKERMLRLSLLLRKPNGKRRIRRTLRRPLRVAGWNSKPKGG